MICNKCNKENNEGARFCKYCGAPLEEPAESKIKFTRNDDSSAEKKNNQPKLSFSVNNDKAGFDVYVEDKKSDSLNSLNGEESVFATNNIDKLDTKQKKKSKKKVFIIIICLLLILASAGAVYYILFYKNSVNLNNGGHFNQNKSNISQVDASTFPDVSLYVNDKNGGLVLDTSNYKIIETDNNGNESQVDCKTVKKVEDSDSLYINFVVSQSKTLSSNNQMGHAKTAANKVIDNINGSNNVYAEITTFGNTVNNKQPFTNNTSLLHSAINSTAATGNSAFYDGLYWALQRTSLKSGCRYVVVFTDGVDNCSKYNKNDVIELSEKTGIPIHIVGIGDVADVGNLRNLANSCKGDYYESAKDDSKIESSLNETLTNIYNTEKSLYKFVFTSTIGGDKKDFRKVRIVYNDQDLCDDVTYVAENDVSPYVNKAVEGDYILAESNTRYYSESELQSMSIWDLYLARNEIYARHGRDFKHQDLKDYFATKSWYHVVYTPEAFDAIQSSVFNDFERKNADLMLQIEKSRNSPYLAP